ncbi:MAG: hypothetical protein KF805_11635 [Phycisphaeraceae bacterium]|nr:hypothetical protein [Phycisphaeraceae bacterium]
MKNERIRPQSSRALVDALLCCAAIASFLAITGCNSAGQGEVTQTDRPAEGAGWAVQEQMAESQGQ